MRKVLFLPDSECVQPLRLFVERQSHRTLILWAADCGERFVDIYEKYFPDDKRSGEALKAAAAWARGEIKMPLARVFILDCHKAAREAEGNPVAQASARAVGHAAATVHTARHALGVVLYGLTALVYAEKPSDSEKFAEEQCSYFYERLSYWEKNIGSVNLPWAKFLQKDKGRD